MWHKYDSTNMITIHNNWPNNETQKIDSNIRRTLVGNKIADRSDVVEHRLSALLQLHLHSRLNIWHQGIRQKQSQDSMGIF